MRPGKDFWKHGNVFLLDFTCFLAPHGGETGVRQRICQQQRLRLTEVKLVFYLIQSRLIGKLMRSNTKATVKKSVVLKSLIICI